MPDLLLPGRVAQSLTCLATDACLTADPGVASSILARSHTFVEIDHEIISTVILLLPLIYSRRVVVSYKRKYVHKLLVNRLFKPAQEKSVVRWTDRPAMTIAVDLGRKATKKNAWLVRHVSISFKNNFYLLVLETVKTKLMLFCISFLINHYEPTRPCCILTNWLLQKQADLDLHCFQLSLLSGFILFLKSLYMVSAKLIWVLCPLHVSLLWDK